jgi:energy-converting hydrogenase A subunit M
VREISRAQTLADSVLQSLSERLDTDIARYVHELRSEKTDIASLVEIHTDAARRLAEILETPTAG